MVNNILNKNIIFFYPSKIVGGAEFLFARLGKYLTEAFNKTVYYIDYNDGFIKNNPEFQSLNFIEYNDEKITLDIDGCLITPLSKIYSLKNELNLVNKKMKILFWSLHPYNVLHVMPESIISQKFEPFILKYILKYFASRNYSIFYNLIKLFSSDNAVFYIDKVNYDLNKFFFEDAVKKKCIPVTIMEKGIENSNIINPNEINVGVLGRLSAEKYSSVLNVAFNLNKLKTNKKINLHIMGDGEYINKICTYKYKNVNFIFKGTIIGDELDEYLTNNIDILFAMGTSLLEGSALKIPTVSVPYCYKEYKTELFYYFFDEDKYSLGCKPNEYKKKAYLPFSKIIDDIYLNNKKKDVGLCCYDYFYKNHSIEKVSLLLLNYIDENELTSEKYNQTVKKSGIIRKNKNIIYKIIKRICK